MMVKLAFLRYRLPSAAHLDMAYRAFSVSGVLVLSAIEASRQEVEENHQVVAFHQKNKITSNGTSAATSRLIL
jgi:hypothetical protein